MGTTAFMSVPYSIYSANPGPQGLQGVAGVDGDDGQDGPPGQAPPQAGERRSPSAHFFAV